MGIIVLVIAGIYIISFRYWYPGDIWYQTYMEKLPPKEFEFTNIEFSDPFAQSGSNEITGWVKNNSKRHTLTALCLYVQLVDYYNGRSEIIGIDQLFISLNVPPQQTHDFKGKPHFGTLPAPKGKYAWLCSIGPVQAVDSKYPVRPN